MNIKRTNTPSPEGQRQLEILRQTVRETLERKRCLGHYAVIWKDGRAVFVGRDAPERRP